MWRETVVSFYVSIHDKTYSTPLYQTGAWPLASVTHWQPVSPHVKSREVPHVRTWHGTRACTCAHVHVMRIGHVRGGGRAESAERRPDGDARRRGFRAWASLRAQVPVIRRARQGLACLPRGSTTGAPSCSLAKGCRMCLATWAPTEKTRRLCVPRTLSAVVNQTGCAGLAILPLFAGPGSPCDSMAPP